MDWQICGFCGRDLKNGEDCLHQDDFGRYNMTISGTTLDSYNREMKSINEVKVRSKHPECWKYSAGI